MVAILDITYAWFAWGVVLKVITPIRLFQSIAGGLLGKATYDGGLPTAALGAVLHTGIACAWSSLFAVAYKRTVRLRGALETTGGAVKVGLAYGAVVWLMMDLVVLPLSRAHPTPWHSWLFLINLAQHAVMVGLPIALIVRERSVTPQPPGSRAIVAAQ